MLLSHHQQISHDYAHEAQCNNPKTHRTHIYKKEVPPPHKQAKALSQMLENAGEGARK